MRRYRAGVAAAFAALTLSCGETSGPPAPYRVAAVSVTPDTAGVELYDTLQLHAAARDSQGTIIAGHSVTWTSSASGIVYARETGVVQALGRGSSTITATVDGVSGTAFIHVVVFPNFVQLHPSSAVLPIGDTLRVQPILYTADGLPPTDSTLTWTSNDTTIARVASGLVSGHGPGTTLITARARDAAAGASIRIIPHVMSVTILPADTSVAVSQRVPFAVIATGPAGDTLSQLQEICVAGCILYYPVDLRSVDTSVARLVSCCTVEAVAAGIDTIVATVDGVTARAVLRVAATPSPPR
jgi:hypothetical protein